MRWSAFIMNVLAALAFVTMWGCGASSPATLPGTESPWNEYHEVVRLHDPFETILGKKGTRWVDGSDVATYGAPTFHIPVEFSAPFTILGEDYNSPADQNIYIQASVAGFFKFTRSSSAIDPPDAASYMLMEAEGLENHLPSPLDNLIMPYWGDLCGVAHQAPGFEGGIHYRYDDNQANAIQGYDMLTIEWKVCRADIPSVTGNFQAKLMLEETQGGSGQHYVTVEFHYGPVSLNWPPPDDAMEFMQGAAVGLKRRGQIDNNPAFFGRYQGIDDGNTLMITHPAFFPATVTAQSRPWVTRVPVYYGAPYSSMNVNSPGCFPEWFTSTPMAFSSGASYSHSPLFHYSFPTTAPAAPGGNPVTGYRVKPVDNDLLTVSARPSLLNFPGDSAIATIDPNEPMVLLGNFRNNGSRMLVNVPVHAGIYLNDSLRAFTSSIIPAIAPGQTITVRFPDTIRLSGGNNLPATHTLCAFHSNPGDQNRGNDTACRYLFLRAPRTRDVGTLGLLSPFLKSPPERSIVPLGKPMDVSARFANTGTVSLDNMVVAGYRILDDRGKEIYKTSSGIRGNWAPGEQRTHTFTPWTPARPGLYYVEIFSALPNDQIRENDTILSNPLGNFIWWGRDGRERPAHHIPFEVRASNEIGICDPKHYPHAPASGSHIRPPFRPAIFLRNHGMARSADISLRLRINRLGSNRSLVSIEEKGAAIDPGFVAEHRFAAIAPETLPPGTYQAWVEVISPGDTTPANNMMQWQFKVDP